MKSKEASYWERKSEREELWKQFLAFNESIGYPGKFFSITLCFTHRITPYLSLNVGPFKNNSPTRILKSLQRKNHHQLADLPNLSKIP